MFRMTRYLRPINKATAKNDRSVLSTEIMLLDVQKPHFFAQMDMTHLFFQVGIHA